LRHWPQGSCSSLCLNSLLRSRSRHAINSRSCNLFSECRTISSSHLLMQAPSEVGKLFLFRSGSRDKHTLVSSQRLPLMPWPLRPKGKSYLRHRPRCRHPTRLRACKFLLMLMLVVENLPAPQSIKNPHETVTTSSTTRVTRLERRGVPSPT
jgi:hypothetical protein